MKSKVKYAALILVIGLLGLAILASPVFGVKPEPKLYTIVISGAIESDVFKTEGNKPRTRFNPFPKEELPVKVMLDFDSSVLPPDKYLYDPTETYPLRCFRWSPLEDVIADLCTGKKNLQILDKIKWEFHHINISGNSLYCRFDIKEYKYDGAWDHYVLDINMEFTEANNEYSGDATIKWTHYTENTKPRGKKQEIEFQHLEYPPSGPPLPGVLTITITPVL